VFYLLRFYSGMLCVLLLYVYVNFPVVLYCRVMAASLESDCRGFMLGMCSGYVFEEVVGMVRWTGGVGRGDFIFIV
jgi:hypothetical protein